jgi:hypothetical protein
VVLLSLSSSVFQVRPAAGPLVLCHPRVRVAGLREGVVGLSGGTVPRAACRIQLAWSLISSG